MASTQHRRLWHVIRLGILLIVTLMLGACSGDDKASNSATPTTEASPTPTLRPTSPPEANPADVPLLNTFSHISGALTVRYPESWIISTEGDEVRGLVDIGNSRSASLGAPTRDDELSIRITWSPALDLVTSDLPPDVDPLTLLTAIIHEWDNAAYGEAQFDQPSTFSIGEKPAARSDGTLRGEKGQPLDAQLILIDFGDGVAGYVVIKTPGDLATFEPLITPILDSVSYGGPPAILEVLPEDRIQPLVEVAHDQAVNGVLITRDSTRMVSWSNDTTAVLRNVSDGAPIQTFQLPTRITSLTLNADESQALILPESAALTLWNMQTGALIATLQANSANTPLQGYAWSPDFQYVLGWAENFESGVALAPLWDVANMPSSTEPIIMPIETYRPSLRSKISSGIWSHAGSQFAIVSTSPQLHAYQVGEDRSFFTATHSDLIFGAVWSTDDQQLATWSQDQSLIVWDVVRQQIVHTLQHERPIRGAVWSGDNSSILSWQVDRVAFLWDATSGQQQFELDLGTASGGAAWSPFDTYILTWSHPDALVPILRVWDGATGELVFDGTGQNILGAAGWSPDERHLATWSEEGIITVWNLNTGDSDFFMRHDGVQGLRWSPDGARLVSWSSDGSIRVWDSDPDVDFGETTEE